MDNNRFGGIYIPREILEDVDIPSTSKILYGFLQSLDGSRGCFASNSYLGGLLGASQETVRASVYLLEKKGYIARFLNDDGSRTIRTMTTLALERAKSTECNERIPDMTNELTPQKNLEGGTEKSVATPPEKSVAYKGNNTDKERDNKGVVDYQCSEDFLVVWKEFKKYRKKLRRPLTEKAEELVLKKLAKTSKETAIKALELSIERSWIGVFPEAVDYALRKNNGRPFANANEPLTDGDHVTF
jgi:hypothetical protein